MKVFAYMAIGIVTMIGGMALRLGSRPTYRWVGGAENPTLITSEQVQRIVWPGRKLPRFSLETVDLLRLGSWALLIAGGVIIAASLIAYWRAPA